MAAGGVEAVAEEGGTVASDGVMTFAEEALERSAADGIDEMAVEVGGTVVEGGTTTAA